jgi:hypothetical protein
VDKQLHLPFEIERLKNDDKAANGSYKLLQFYVDYCCLLITNGCEVVKETVILN